MRSDSIICNWPGASTFRVFRCLRTPQTKFQITGRDTKDHMKPRIVSLLPAATEIVSALGLMDSLVGVSHECDYPPEANGKPHVTVCSIHQANLSSEEIDRRVRETLAATGTLYHLDEQLLHRLRPDLILTQKLCDVCAVGYGSVAKLAATLPGPPRLVNLEPICLNDVFDNINAVAVAAGVGEKGQRVVAQLQERVDVVRERTQAVSHRPRCFLMEWAEPLFCAGHWNPELVELAGGTEVIGRKGERSTSVEWLDVLRAKPEVIVLALCGFNVERTLQDLPLLQRLPGWNELPAVRTKRVYAVDANAYFSRPGPRLVDSLELLAGLLHPTLFPEFVPACWQPHQIMRV